MGLVAAGSGARTFLNRLPSLPAKLGPIKSATYSTARRLVVSLRCGFAVPNYGALEFCPVVWVAVPEADLDAVMEAFATQTTSRKTMVVVCESKRDSSSFEALKTRGLRVATLNAVEEGNKSPFVVEGHRDTVRFLRKLLDADHRSLVEIRTGAKAGYFAGIHLMTHLLCALVTSSINCLQASGIPRAEALTMASALATRSVKAHSRTGAKPWSRPELLELRQALDSRAVELREICPLESEVYAQAVTVAIEYFQRLGAPPKARSHHA